MINMVKLSEVSDLTVGYVGPMGKEYVENGTLFLRSLNIKPFSFDLTDVKYITEDFNETISKSILHYNDVVIVRTGIPGIAAVVPKEFDGCNCSDLVIVHPDTSKINPYYLCAFINSWGRLQVKNAKVGAIQKHFNVTEAKEMLIPLPDMEEQNLIANILRDINGKINLNNKIHSKLDSLLHSIYDYWFLQFEFPNEEGKPYKSSGGKMVWNDELKREIPEGWKVKSVDEAGVYVTDYTANGSFKSLADNVKYNEGTPYALLVRIVDFNNNFEKGNDFVYVNKHAYDFLSKSALNPDDIIICNVGAVGNIYRCPDLGMPMTLGPNGIVLRHDTLENYLFTHFSSQLGQNQIKSISSGSIQEKFNKTNFRDLKLAIPDKMTLSKFDNLYCSLYEQNKTLWQENQELASLRDFLLPMLMNGQVTFKEDE